MTTRRISGPVSRTLSDSGGLKIAGILGRALAQDLLTHGERVVEVSPHLTGRQRRRSQDAAKSDAHDALAVARVVLQEGNKLHPVAREDPTMQVKLLVAQRDNLVAERTRLLNQLHGQFTEVEPSYKRRVGLLPKPEAVSAVSPALGRADPSGSGAAHPPVGHADCPTQ